MSRARGFSLVELLVVLGIAFVLIVYSLVNYNGLRGRQLDSVAQNFGGQVAQSLAAYLSIYLHVSPTDLMSSALSSLPAADWSGFPGQAPASGDTRGCNAAFVLPKASDPPDVNFNGGPSDFRWGNPIGGIRCVIIVNAAGRFEVYTWRNGAPAGKYFINGQAP